MRNDTKPLNINDNNDVIKALKESDEYAFENVYRYYFRGLCAFCSQYVPLSEAEEIVQDTMMWLWENRSSLIADLTLKTLLFTIVKNKALNRITHYEVKRKVHQEIADKYEKEFADPDFYLENELIKLYNKALEKLPAEFRESYEMNRKDHLTHKEIAQKLNVSPQTINYRIGQALKILRIELKDYLPLLFLLLHHRL
ncbi:RNA polymerase sigma-70 factor [Oscillospiraceae bacterium N12]|jgi:RNA polymerase sigma-70 factor (ECF subfamily)|uniref:RNA polymerase sigma-70 factor n=1 Tax=Jilunia laotingensis TaxID=2763675 RepID=A0A926F3N0_9BACT|nr:RNA polymerase sigma-70 factor [Jilunia laotingensis]MBC8595143.1 RNA polymerase sigma-70 factor [Jilunia laotingensis]